MGNKSFLTRLTPFLPVFSLAVVAALALRRIDDFDTWWHLASGRWIATHVRVPHTDPLSFTVTSNEWINLQWLYDLSMYQVYTLAGANGLVIASTACFVATFVLLLTNVRRALPPLAVTLWIVWVAMTVSERLLVRPEMATFPLLAGVLLVLAQGRGNEGRRLWLLAPLMLAWANLHSLFIVGLAAIMCACGGALIAETPLLPRGWRRDSAWPAPARRRLLVWGATAAACTALNPYLYRAWVFPFELMSRIDGSRGVYQVIGEFRPPFSGYFPTFAMGSYQTMILAGAVVVIAAGLVRASGRADGHDPARDGAFDVGALVFTAALAWLSLLARRNVGVFAIGAAPFLAQCAKVLASRLPRAWRSADGIVISAITAAMPVALVALMVFVASNAWYARTGETHESGLGVFKANFPVRAVEFFRAQGLPGPTYNDMTAGGYLTWDDPSGKGVYIDGRLEVYDTEFFSQYMQSLGDGRLWLQEVDRRGINSAILFHRWGNRQSLIRFLLGGREWGLVYYDEVAAVFVRLSAAGDSLTRKARADFVAEWRPRTDALLDGPLATWSWQWPIERYTAIIAYARLIEVLGDRELALALFEKALALPLPPDYQIETAVRAAQYRAARGDTAQARMHLERARRLAPHDPELLAMIAELNAAGR
ncbi:MAG: tetratricopeptide repeat protein [Deltaproteobacteria bacterium]|nr:tetratricopeptide repeat protein [Deltaproteobacteria bacterium]